MDARHTRRSHAHLALVAAAALGNVGHHLDHVLRGATGWPLTAEVNPFTYSLGIYPAIAVALVLAVRGRSAPRFGVVLAGGGAAFVLLTHVGPVAGDAVGEIPSAYASPLAGWAAVLWLVLFVGVLVVLSATDLAAWRRGGRRGGGVRDLARRRPLGRPARDHQEGRSRPGSTNRPSAASRPAS